MCREKNTATRQYKISLRLYLDNIYTVDTLMTQSVHQLIPKIKFTLQITSNTLVPYSPKRFLSQEYCLCSTSA